MKSSTKKGYTLLFAVIVSVLLLSIGAFILSVSRKEAILSSSSRDSVYAFYAADSGLECALENLTTLITIPKQDSVTCGSNSFTISSQDVKDPNSTTTFYMLTGSGTNFSSGGQSTQSGVASCATVIVSHTQTVAAVPPQTDTDGKTISGSGHAASYETDIVSRGNNIGWKQNSINGNVMTGDCSITGPRKVERALEYTTQN